MGSHTFEILRQGIWASVTGGWFYDPRQHVFSNTFHLYLWLFLLGIPLTLYLYVPISEWVWGVYSCSILLAMLVLKIINYRLHGMFDTSECIEEPIEQARNDPSQPSGGDASPKPVTEVEEVEMDVLGPKETPPIACSSRNSFTGVEQRRRDIELTTNPVAVSYLNRKPHGATIEVDVHRNNGCSSNDEYSCKSTTERIRPRKRKRSPPYYKSSEGATCLTIDDVIMEDEVCAESPRSESAHVDSCSHPSLNSQPSQDSNLGTSTSLSSTGGRYGNMSNLACSKGAGSLDFLYYHTPRSGKNPNLQKRVRRTKSALETCPAISAAVCQHPLALPSYPASLEGMNHPPHREPNQVCASTIDEEHQPTCLDSDEEFSNNKGSQSPLLSRHKSLDQGKNVDLYRQKTSCLSLDKAYPPMLKKKTPEQRDERILGSDNHRSSPTLSCSPCYAATSLSASTLTELLLSDSPSMSPHSAAAARVTASSDAADSWSLYSSLGLNWLFEQPSTSQGATSRSSSSDSSTNEAMRLLPDQQELGARPKRREEKPETLETVNPNFVDVDLRSELIKILNQSDVGETARELGRLRHQMPETEMVERVLMTTLPPFTPTPVKKRPKKLANRRRIFRQESGELSRKRQRRSSRQSSGSSRSRDGTEPNLSALASMIAGPGTHLANSHDDTTEGAVHWFQDEHGNWLTYTFNEKSAGTASGVIPVANPLLLNTLLGMQQWEEDECSSSGSASSGLTTIIIDNPTVEPTPTTESQLMVDASPPPPLFVCPTNLRLNNRSPLQLLADSLLERTRAVPDNIDLPRMRSATDTEFGSLSNRLRFTDEQAPKSRHYYKFWLMPFYFIKIYFDRLSLLALLDRNLTKKELILTVFLAVMVAVLGSLLLEKKVYHDLSVFVFCAVIASCQYSLLKSVQPDAASPTHGYNRVVAFSRPVYFCIISLSILLLELSLAHGWYTKPFLFYGFRIHCEAVVRLSIETLGWTLLLFPLIFTIGLLPQVNTFVMYLLEQFDILVFGGNAAVSLISAVYCIGRSMLAVGTLYAFAFFALKNKESSQHIVFSMFCGLLVAVSYHLSRSASDPSVMWTLLKKHVLLEQKQVTQQVPEEKRDSEGVVDPLPEKLENTVITRLKSDLLVCILIGVLVFAVHISTVFTALQPILYEVLWITCSVFGMVIHYIIPQVRKELPWLCFSHPFLKANEYDCFEVKEAAKIMWFEKLYVCACFLERNVLYPLVILSALTRDSPLIVERFGIYLGTLIVVICGVKCLRCAYSDASPLFLVLLITVLLFRYDLEGRSETFLMDFWLMIGVCSKLYELVLKVKFVITYIAPWQITWGSAFHAFAQPFSVPHSGMLFIQTIISAILSTPLNPFLGSAIFLTSYMRPIKFWERDYNTKRVDHTNTRLSAHIERNPGADDNNLNSIFYEHLTRSLQHSLYGDLALGRWGNAGQGDCFVLASDNLNCLVHIVEMGNGLVTFQVRGLEFRGTYCQQREVEAISEGAEDDVGCCCCEPGHLPHMLSVNAAFNQRWLAWQLTQTTYVLEGYSISDNSAQSMLQVFDLRKILVTYYVKAIVYYTLRSSKLEEWLQSEVIAEALAGTLEKGFADLDPVFSVHIDEDLDFRAAGISRNSFCNVYWDWLQYCASREKRELDCAKDSMLVSLCLSLSLLGRRTLASSSHNPMTSVDLFLHGLHQLFKGVFDTSSARDEWVYCDMDLVKRVIIPAVRMALKLHQDHFTFHDEYEDNERLYDAIRNHEETLVIAHEGNPAWRSAVLAGRQSLLALRHVSDDGAEEYKVIMLNKRWLSFRVIKLNRECVRGLWAGQQQELVYLRNRNPERGSIQNAKQALRNMINSSCDQPIGYPIYVSPLTTSYADTSEQLCSVVGGPASFSTIKDFVVKTWTRLRMRCGESCSSGGSMPHLDAGFNEGTYIRNNITPGIPSGSHHSVDSSVGGSLGRASTSGSYTLNKPTIASLAGLLNSSDNPLKQRAKILDPNQVYDNLNGGRRIDPLWPDERMRARGGRVRWNNWFPEAGMEGWVVHRWVPFHRDPRRRSNLDKVILLLQIGDRYVPIAESGVEELGAEV